MTKEQRNRLQSMLTTLDRAMDRIEEKMEKAEAENDLDKYKRLDARWEMKHAEYCGIKKTLEALGFSVKEQWAAGGEKIEHLILD